MGKQNEFSIRFLSSLILPFVESYWVTLSFLANIDQSLNHKQGMIEQKVQWLAETLYDEGLLLYYECCSLESIGNSIEMFAKLNILRTKPFKEGEEPVYYLSEN